MGGYRRAVTRDFDGLLSGPAVPAEHDLNGPLVGAADDGQLQGAATGRLQRVEEVIHAADRAASGRR